jgi:hypothetical protein
MSELLSCPFCGSKDWNHEAYSFFAGHEEKLWELTHRKGCFYYDEDAPAPRIYNEAQAISWNSRAQSAEVERLREAAEKIISVWFEPVGDRTFVEHLAGPIKELKAALEGVSK